ncbi:MAG TPA: FAD-dependent monooxygenase [Solirubrobacteraceae bacterium]|nr:FAD-dependent monooxygenase [Solirubrobacteraceae bacterium]
MAKVILLGGGFCGLASGLMLARDGHQVTVLERDASPLPESPERAWEAWERQGVAQFRQAHYMQPRGRHVLEAELPDVLEGLREADATVLEWGRMLPPTIADRSPRPGDERLATVTARRSTLEHAMASAAARQDGLTVRRGAGAERLETRERDGAVHVVGVRTDDGDVLSADLVVDATGRRSRMPALLREAGGPEVAEEGEDSGFVYYTRFFRSADGSTPAPRGPLNSPFESHSILTLPADAGTWSVTLYGAAADPPLKRFRHEPVWTAVMRACPLHAHWLDGEPMTGILPMGGVMDRRRRLPADGTLTGVALLADAWACTNPSVGRGMTFGLMHGALLRNVLRSHAAGSAEFAAAWDEVTEREMGPWYEATVTGDRARIAQLRAARDGGPYVVPADPASRVRAALFGAMAVDADAFRAGIEILGCLALPSEVLARPGLAERVTAAAAARGDARLPGPGRAELLELVSSAGAPAAAG